MAERRMFTGKITESDAFLDMPLSSQCLYFHLCMYADDEGFVKNPKRIQRMVGAADDDMKVLIGKNFVISYESGVIVIKHWKMHNLIRKDRMHITEYQDEKSMLYVKKNGTYTLDPLQGEPLLTTKCQPNDNQVTTKCHTEVRLGKDNINNNIYILSSEEQKKSEIISEIIDYLNKATGKNYRATTGKTKTCINARLKEGFTVEDFKTVIDIKCKKWLKDDKMRDYLRPETLFGTKFEGYLNEAPQKKTEIPKEIPKEEIHITQKYNIRPNYTEFPQEQWSYDEVWDAEEKGIITEEEAYEILG